MNLRIGWTSSLGRLCLACEKLALWPLSVMWILPECAELISPPNSRSTLSTSLTEMFKLTGCAKSACSTLR
jgi:hypothetical protein